MPSARVTQCDFSDRFFYIHTRSLRIFLSDQISVTHFHNYSHTLKVKSQEELKTLDIGARLLDNTAFVRIHVVGRFSKEISVVRGLRSRGFQL